MKKEWILISSLLLMAVSGCNKGEESNTAAEESGRKLVQRELSTSGLDLEEIDINKDGKVDQKVYSKKGVIQYAIRDFNFDDTTDMIEFYEEGNHVRDEIDLDYDGICDLIVTYKDGVPVKKEFSIDFEGNRHGTQYYDAQGNRTEIHRDSNGDGILDVIEYYRPGETEAYKVTKVGQADEDE